MARFGLHNMLGPQFLLSLPAVRERDHFFELSARHRARGREQLARKSMRSTKRRWPRSRRLLCFILRFNSRIETWHLKQHFASDRPFALEPGERLVTSCDKPAPISEPRKLTHQPLCVCSARKEGRLRGPGSYLPWPPRARPLSPKVHLIRQASAFLLVRPSSKPREGSSSTIPR